MPKEYIEREKVLEIAKDEYYSDFHRSMADLTSLEELLEDTPAADVVEVKHGKWTDNYNGTSICSVCGGKSPNMNFCGRCGAKMDGKDGEQ